jgi:23S rRNA (cytidine2498-2'-O)-methyltransferase
LADLSTPTFLFVVCQQGAEPALKAEFARLWPDLRFAFSRSGFVTFKLPPDIQLPPDFDAKSVFARTHGFSLGRTESDDAGAMAREVWNLASGLQPAHLHVWERDKRSVGVRGYEPGLTTLAQEVGQTIVEHFPDEQSTTAQLALNQTAPRGSLVLDCVIVEPNQWWIGWHRAASVASRWPGGVPQVDLDREVVGRAYWKMHEALAWSRLPIAEGDLCVEIGSAPGGSVQCLLERDLRVIGIDPAEMSSAITEHPCFVHIRKRASDVRRREFRNVRWLMADSNVAPKHTLDTVEQIVTHDEVHIRGMILTLKLLDWQLAEQIPHYIERVRSWGYQYVRVRQLAYNRREFCLIALRRRAMIRQSRPSKRTRR